jgi:hypothetical protein
MIALVEFLSNQDLIELKDNLSLLDATREAASKELIKRQSLKTEENDL